MRLTTDWIRPAIQVPTVLAIVFASDIMRELCSTFYTMAQVKSRLLKSKVKKEEEGEGKKEKRDGG